MTTLIPQYYEGSTGAVNKPINYKLAENISVFDFMTPAQIAGVQGTGSVVDVTSAIQSALNAVPDQTFGTIQSIQRIYFPSGIYPISSTLTHTGHFLQLVGDGYQSCLKWTGSQYGTMMSITGVLTDPNGDFVIQDMGFNLNSLATTGLQTQTLSHEITISRILFANGIVNPSNGNQSVCENLVETHSGRIEQCYFATCSNNAISLDRTGENGGPTAWVIDQNEFQQIDAFCVFAGNATNLKISNNIIDNTGTSTTGNSAGFSIYASNQVVIENNYAESIQQSLISINAIQSGSTLHNQNAIIRDNYAINLPLNSSYQAINIGGVSPSFNTYNVHIYDNAIIGTVAYFANVGTSSHQTRLGHNVFSRDNGSTFDPAWAYVTGSGDWYYDGQYQVSNALQGVASAVSLTSGTTANVTSLTLPPGDWDIYGKLDFAGGTTTTVSYLNGGYSLVSATTPTDYAAISSEGTQAGTPFSTVNKSLVLPTYRVSISSSTTYYLVATAGFATSTCSVYGIIQARIAKTYV